MTLLNPTQEMVNELRDQGLKMTSPRYRVLEKIAGHTGNFTAEELAAELAPVGRATVYRTIKLLLDRGLVCQVMLSDGSVCYRPSYQSHHHHLVCVSCGATEDVRLAEVESVLSGVHEVAGYDVIGHRVEVYGFCPNCKT